MIRDFQYIIKLLSTIIIIFSVRHSIKKIITQISRSIGTHLLDFELVLHFRLSITQLKKSLSNSTRKGTILYNTGINFHVKLLALLKVQLESTHQSVHLWGNLSLSIYLSLSEQSV